MYLKAREESMRCSQVLTRELEFLVKGWLLWILIITNHFIIL